MDVSVGVRYTDAYRYESLLLLAQMKDNHGILHEDTLVFDLTERIKDGFSYRKQTQTFMQLNPDSSSAYSLLISHLMDNDTIIGVSDIICDIK